jgi:hypothetical protein
MRGFDADHGRHGYRGDRADTKPSVLDDVRRRNSRSGGDRMVEARFETRAFTTSCPVQAKGAAAAIPGAMTAPGAREPRRRWSVSRPRGFVSWSASSARRVPKKLVDRAVLDRAGSEGVSCVALGGLRIRSDGASRSRQAGLVHLRAEPRWLPTVEAPTSTFPSSLREIVYADGRFLVRREGRRPAVQDSTTAFALDVVSEMFTHGSLSKRGGAARFGRARTARWQSPRAFPCRRL